MALRLGTYVLEGELWNTKRHSTSGWLHLRGADHLLRLNLTGNPAEDLQGCKIRFEPGEVSRKHFSNLEEGDGSDRPEIDLAGIALRQIGVTGQITAVRWGRVLSTPISELMEKKKKDEKDTPPSADWHRLLYMEWYSQNGRVVLELPAPEMVFLEGEDAWDPEPPEKEVQDLLSKVRNHLEDLQGHLRERSRDTGVQVQLPFEFSSPIPGLKRILLLVPPILERVDEDLLAGNIRPDVPDQKDYVLDGLQMMDRCIRGILHFFRTNLLDDPIRLFSESLELGASVALIPKHVNLGRFFDDVERLLPDLRAVHHTWKNMKRNRLRQPDVPEGEEVHRPEAWYEYFEQKLMMEEPVVRIPTVEGVTRQSLEKGSKLQQNEREELDREIEREQEIREIVNVRSAVFDPEHPEQFLDLEDLPDEEDVSEEDPAMYNEAPHESDFLESLPKLKEWEDVKDTYAPETCDKSHTDEDEIDHPFSHENDPIKEWFIQFAGDFSDRIHELAGDEERLLENRPELAYLEILSIKPGPRIAGSYTWIKTDERIAPVHGAYLHAISCLRRIKQGIEQFKIEGLTSFLDRIRDGIENIKQQLNGSR